MCALAEQLPGFGELWVDDRGDSARLLLITVVNVRVTGGLDEVERKLRAVWGGPLCVSKAQHSAKHLSRVLEQVGHQRGFLSGSHNQDGRRTLGGVR